MNNNWAKIYASNDFYQAEIVRQVLIDNEVEAVLMNKQDTAYKLFGEVEIHVPQENVQKAAEIIAQYEL